MNNNEARNKILPLILSLAFVMAIMTYTAFATETVVAEIRGTIIAEKEENVNVPTTPTLSSVTSTVIVLNGGNNCEYSLDGEKWQKSYIFKELQPNTTYHLYQRYAETETILASKASEPLEVTTKGKSSITVSPKLVSVKGNVVTLIEVPGYEYKFVGGEWQDESVFVLDSFTTYEFVQREKETNTMEAGDVSGSISVSTVRITKLPDGAIGIYTKSDLDAIRNKTSSNAYYVLMNDINFIDADFEEYGEFYNDGCGWTSINNFSGKIDGNGYSIKGLKSVSDKNTCFVNTNNGDILNLTLEGIEFIARNENHTAYLYLAGMVDSNSGIIEGCNVSGKIIAENTNGNYVSGAAAGGICAANYGEVNQCSNIATVFVEAYDWAYAGGIVGSNNADGIVEDCYNAGEILTFINDDYNANTYAGGIAGENFAKIKTCYNIGAIDSRRNDSVLGAYSGGIVGDNNGVMENCYYSELQQNASDQNSGTGAVKLTLEKLKQQDSYIGFDFEETWSMGSGDSPIPYLKDKVTLSLSENTTEFAGGKGIVISPYYIMTKQQLANINSHLGAAYILKNDLTFEKDDFEEGGMFYNDGKGWLSIGSQYYMDFEGIFDGQNNTVSGLVMYNQKYMGLFGCSHGEIKNINVEDIYIESGSIVTVYAGGIAGAYYGSSLRNCTANAHIEVNNVNDIAAGSIVGLSTGDIIQCLSLGEITLDSTTCDGTTRQSAGGIAGRCGGSVKDSGSWSNVYSSHDRRSYIYIGGIIGGPNKSLTIENCYNVGKLYCKSNDNIEKDCSTKLYGNSSSSYDITVTNSYILNDDEAVLVNGKDIAKRASQFLSGEVTYFLNNGNSNSSSVWRQNLGKNGEAYPVLDSDHNIVYRCDKYNCQNQLDGCIYSNIEESVHEKHDIIYHEAKEATCSMVGWEAYESCKNCDYTTYKEIGRKGHTWVNILTVDRKATCTEEGYKSIHCSECDATKDSAIIPMASTVQLATAVYTYNDKSISPKVIIKDANGNQISEDNYTVITPAGRKNAGKYTYTVAFKNDYRGTKDLILTINPARLTVASLSADTYAYNGKIITPSVTAKAGTLIAANMTTKDNSNIELTYAKGRKNVGTYKVVVKGKGNYAGTIIETFKINPKTTYITYKSGAKKAFMVKWKKQPNQVTGYQIRYSTSSKMKKAKAVTIKRYKTTSRKITKLKAKKKYYVQVRTYKTVSGKKYYSTWSAKKHVKTK